MINETFQSAQTAMFNAKRYSVNNAKRTVYILTEGGNGTGTTIISSRAKAEALANQPLVADEWEGPKLIGEVNGHRFTKY